MGRMEKRRAVRIAKLTLAAALTNLVAQLVRLIAALLEP